MPRFSKTIAATYVFLKGLIRQKSCFGAHLRVLSLIGLIKLCAFDDHD